MTSLSELAARRLRGDASAEQGGAEYTERRARLVRAATESRARGGRLWLWLLLALAAGLLVGWYALAIDRATSFCAGAAVGEVGTFYSAELGGELPLRFGDGSEVQLGSSARARVTRSEVGRRAVVLEAGRARADLAELAGFAWEVSAGPFLLRSPGASFELSWDVGTQALAVNLRSGSVLVDGPGLAGGRRLVGSQRLQANVPSGKP